MRSTRLKSAKKDTILCVVVSVLVGTTGLPVLCVWKDELVKCVINTFAASLELHTPALLIYSLLYFVASFFNMSSALFLSACAIFFCLSAFRVLRAVDQRKHKLFPPRSITERCVH